MTRKKKSTSYRIIDSWMKRSGKPEREDPNNPGSAWWLLYEGDRRGCMSWIMNGMRHTEGAERDHYVDLLLQLEDGFTELDYRRV